VATLVEFSKKFFGEFYVILLPFLMVLFHTAHAKVQLGISICNLGAIDRAPTAAIQIQTDRAHVI
jgi:hypothetical protein